MGPLTAYWIVPPPPPGPLGFGITAWSLEDVLRIIRAMGYEMFLPEDLNELVVREGVTVAELDQGHVVPNMGPIAVRGLWFPFVAVGLPAWAEQRMGMMSRSV